MLQVVGCKSGCTHATYVTRYITRCTPRGSTMCRHEATIPRQSVPGRPDPSRSDPSSASLIRIEGSERNIEDYIVRYAKPSGASSSPSPPSSTSTSWYLPSCLTKLAREPQLFLVLSLNFFSKPMRCFLCEACVHAGQGAQMRLGHAGTEDP